MARDVPARSRWAVDRLPLAARATVLEIGAGPGLAVELIGARLAGGHIIALDRSPIAAERISAGNAAMLDQGRLAIETMPIEEFSAPEGSIDLVFAVNVNLFWLDAGAALAVIRRILTRDSSLHLFIEPPTRKRAMEVVPLVRERLSAGGFVIIGETVEPLGDAVAVHVAATPRR